MAQLFAVMFCRLPVDDRMDKMPLFGVQPKQRLHSAVQSGKLTKREAAAGEWIAK
jgi:hypothetical protein